ncbi:MULTISPECIES: NAD(P)/FAD-dependent oxidoreductase [unclassified Fusibacter]|uniref:NAD(P)/FAD-dependent oxidoreductase n=1 Tax=unclassified Fusibacter TaxID=2624464 RepID=UPI001012617F|nr:MULTISPECIES: NAD(P)/FAD-dependent oxidoreductase [unclassified Fusibacter]MCK8060499.1 NAD(P)/FAD-dependent oxidoreductase [Fusibacter sp. A2]NPE20212.1 NAD(P)/FAD-dependent oxidoreductase [Fusibacter sp. A1]RXV63421.1 NAD(P)/FAD-dependent oxidoreductase [Fusibacter sp. A1]
MSLPKYAVLQKPRGDKRTYAITPRIAGGFATPDELRKIAETAEKYHGTLKITSGQRIAILGISAEDVEKAWEDLGMDPGVVSPYSVKNIEMCPASFCKRAKQNSMKLAMKLEKRFYGAATPNRMKIGVVGCMNSCTSANSKDIAVLANDEGYVIRAGGSAGFHPRLPDDIAENLNDQEAFDMVEAIYLYYCETADMGEKLGDYIDRISLETFKTGVYERYTLIQEEQKQ